MFQGIEIHAQHAGQQFQLGVGLAVACGTRIRGNRFELPEHRWKTFADIPGIRFAIHDDGEDVVAAAQTQECFDLLVDPL